MFKIGDFLRKKMSHVISNRDPVYKNNKKPNIDSFSKSSAFKKGGGIFGEGIKKKR